MKNQVVLASADSGCWALIINQLVVAESDLTKSSIELVRVAARQTSIALQVPLIECTFEIPDAIDGNWVWKDVLHLLQPNILSTSVPSEVSAPASALIPSSALNETEEFERAMRMLGYCAPDFIKVQAGINQTYVMPKMELYRTVWGIRAKIADQTVAPYLAALQDLAQVDGSYANVRDAEVLAARVRLCATTALRMDPIREARATAAMQFASAMTAACKLEGQAMRDAVTAATKAAREAGIDTEKVGLN